MHVIDRVGLFLSQIPKGLFATWGVGWTSPLRDLILAKPPLQAVIVGFFGLKLWV